MQTLGLERVLTATDRLVSWTPRPLRSALERPVSPPRSRGGSAPRAIVRFTLGVSLVMFVLLAGLHLANAVLWSGSHQLLDADDDRSLWSWASIAVESLAAGVLALLAVTSARRGVLAFCAVAVTFFSLDDFVRIHENLGAVFGGLFPHAARAMWPVLYMPLLVALLIQLWRVAEGLDERERGLVRGGLVALVVAVGLEFSTPLIFAIGQDIRSAGYAVEVALEEGFELCGWIWIAGGLAAGLVRRLENPAPGVAPPPFPEAG
ncbi:MAG: hypothetical protein ABI776_11955 [Nocardioidaceae bacterium]